MPTALQREHTDAIIATLAALGLTVGDADAEGLTPPYEVVYAIPGGSTSGTLENPDENAVLIYQVTGVGATRDQAELMNDKAMVLLDGFEVPGRYIARVSLESHGGIRRDDDGPDATFTATPRFRVLTTPA